MAGIGLGYTTLLITRRNLILFSMNQPISLITSGDSVALQQNFNAQHDVVVRAHAPTPNEVISLVDHHNPKVVILSSVHTEWECIEIAGHILKIDPDTQVIIIASDNACSNTTQVIEMGAASYLPQNVNTNELLDTIRTVANDQVLFYF